MPENVCVLQLKKTFPVVKNSRLSPPVYGPGYSCERDRDLKEPRIMNDECGLKEHCQLCD